ncbi:hypothetical protein ACFY4C_10915 [Actinomadura viridis]|uniref:hypothetical protein n=1 Tax=Actinomadura viridis TaxID=58110 RepID=UPI003696B075
MRVGARGAAVLVVCVVAAGCGSGSAASTGALEAGPPTVTGSSGSAPAVTDPSAAPSPSDTAEGTGASPASPPKPLGEARSWRITTYYTVVQTFHGGPLKPVRGCPGLHCKWGRTPLGSYPEDFLKEIQTEGGGRITTGPHRGRYLNWSHSVGWWLDDSTRDSTARPLKAWSSAAADRDVLARGQRFRIVDCGKDWRGRPVAEEVCARFRTATWKVTDLFRPGYGGEHHADVYIGEETGPGFKKSPFYTTLRKATIAAP